MPNYVTECKSSASLQQATANINVVFSETGATRLISFTQANGWGRGMDMDLRQDAETLYSLGSSYHRSSTSTWWTKEKGMESFM